jgi:hypothetical protein
MTASESIKSTSVLKGDLGGVPRRYLGKRTLLLTVAMLALAAIAALNWSWLMAAGVASIVLSVLPCLVMCGLGLCMSKMIGRPHPARESQVPGAQSTEGPSALVNATTGGAAAELSSCCQPARASPQNSPTETPTRDDGESHA